jgi:hypothetical protein
MRILKVKYLTVVLLAIASFALQQARADFISSLNSPNDAISPFNGPYGSVTVHLVDSTHAIVTFSGNTVNGNIYLLGGAQGTDLNINGTATASNFSFSQAGQTNFLAPSEVGQSSQNVNGHGTFDLSIDYFNGFKHAFTGVTFDLSATGGTTWSSASNVLEANSLGFDAAAHIFVTTSPPNGDNTALATGFAGENGGGSVPDGGMTATMLGMTLCGLAAVRRYLSI